MEMTDSDKEMLKNLNKNIEAVKYDLRYYEDRVKSKKLDLQVLENYKNTQFKK